MATTKRRSRATGGRQRAGATGTTRSGAQTQTRGRRGGMGIGEDALSLLAADHRKVQGLFEQAERTNDDAKKKQLVDQIVRELSMHAAIEEQVFYPAARNAVKSAEDVVLESLEEHHVVKWTCSELEKMSPDDERFDAKLTVLKESVMHHVDEEENELFPQVKKALSREDLMTLGQAMTSAKKMAPKRPHPRAPDTPPGNILAGLGAGIADRVRELVRGVAKAPAKMIRRGTGTKRASARGRTTRTTRRTSARG